MTNWYEIPGALEDFENNPAYHEKLAIDADIELVKNVKPANKQTFCRTDCSWVKKRIYKKKLVRRFLTINPDMDYSKLHGMRCSPAIYLCFPDYNNGDFYDPKMTYSFNPYTQYSFRFGVIFGNIMARHFLVAAVMHSDRRIRMPQKSQTGEFAATLSTRT